ncbi:amidohydrolase family protein [Actinobaculum sp. 352]|uniref:N-acetylglucosamine-6-phosphate deacetylase n=1 Tax=Actinobaculum sp. 352 TaxID=2490946 RepID=UPI001F49652D|nr:amidohydrolase family protein [Actinobaculum sp. 352]
MMLYTGKVYDGYGEAIGAGLELDDGGRLVRVVTSDYVSSPDRETMRRDDDPAAGSPTAHPSTDGGRSAFRNHTDYAQRGRPKDTQFAATRAGATADSAAEHGGTCGAFIIPGLVDIHCHGGGGVSFSDLPTGSPAPRTGEFKRPTHSPGQLACTHGQATGNSPQPACTHAQSAGNPPEPTCTGDPPGDGPDRTADGAIETAILTHRRRGTTALLASLVSLAEPEPYIDALIPLCETGELAGIHLEGPFISPRRAGAQNPHAIQPIDLAKLRDWLTRGRGWIRTVTLAPELPGADDAALLALSHGAHPSWGHTNADAATARKLLDAICKPTSSQAARQHTAAPQMITHLFNGMTPFSHREPGPVREFICAARSGRATAEIIADGVHVAPEVVEDVLAFVASRRSRRRQPLGVCFVTDASAAAGSPPGRFLLGRVAVELRAGGCYVAGTDTLAGGATTLADQLRLFALRGRLPFGSIVNACVATPALAAGIASTPGVTLTFERGHAPSFLVLDSTFRVVAVVREGHRLTDH